MSRAALRPRRNRRTGKIGVLLAVCLALSGLAACDKAQIGARPADTRTSLHMTAKELEHLRHGMRVYLDSTQGIVEALAENKMSRIAESAHKAGMGALRELPLWSAVSLPPEFVVLGLDTHRRFDALAAARMGSKGEVLQHLRDILANCTACHATYRVAPHGPKTK